MAIKVNGTTVVDNGRNAAVSNANISGGANFGGTSSLRIPSGTTTQRPASPIAGQIRFNTDTSNIEQYDGNSWSNVESIEKGSLTKTFSANETATVNLTEPTPNATVSVTKEVPQTGITNNDWDVAADGSNFTLHDTAYDATLTPSNATGNGSFTLGTGSFASTDVGKRIVGNGGEAILTATDGSYELRTAFNDTSAIGAGDWSMFGLDVDSDDAGLILSSFSGIPAGVSSYNNNIRDQYFSAKPLLTTGISYRIWLTPSQNETDTLIRPSNHQYSTPAGFQNWVEESNGIIEKHPNASGSISGDSWAPSDNWEAASYTIEKNSGAWYFEIEVSSDNNMSGPAGAGHSNTWVSNGGVPGFAPYNGQIYYSGDGSSSPNTSVYTSSGSATDHRGYAIDLDNGVAWIRIAGTWYPTEPVITLSSGEPPTYATNQNHAAITSTSTNTEFWADINSMTADETLNDGAVYYAVSTDDRTTWSIIDDTKGVRNIVRNNGGTWEVNDASDYSTETWVPATQNDEFYALEEAVDSSTAQVSTGFGLENASYDSVSFDVTGQVTNPQGITFNNDGTKMFIVDRDSDSIYQYSLSTAFDLSTANYDNVSFSVAGQVGVARDIAFNNDGTKMFIVDRGGALYQYSLSAAFDLSTASYDNVSFDVSGQDINPTDIVFNNDGTKMYIAGRSSESLYQYSLSTAFDLNTASYDSVSFSVSGQDSNPFGIAFNTDGTKIYVLGLNSDSIYQYTLSTAFDLSTASYDNVSFSVAGQDSTPWDIVFNNDGTKMYIIGNTNDFVYQYTTESTTSTTSTNRMDSTQLNAVSDGNHYTLGNNLDLAITLFMADGNTNPPTSDGVSINYDGNAINRLAVLGTDYTYQQINDTTVSITSTNSENLKIRVV